MLSYIKKLLESGNELDVEERNLLSVAYKNSVGSKRTSWRILDTLLNKDKDKKDSEVEKHRQLVKDFKKQVEKELDTICREIIDTLDKHLIKDPSTIGDDEDVSPQVFYLKMKGDYYRYIAEYAQGSDREDVADKAFKAYQQAEKLAEKKMDTTDPIRLGLALNFSVFHYEIRSDPKKACDLAKTAFDDAIADIENIQDTNYKDSTTIMQLMSDNLTLWTSELDENDDDNEDEEA